MLERLIEIQVIDMDIAALEVRTARIPQQIAALNKLVLGYCVKAVYGQAQGYMKYKFDASTLVVPIALPIMSKTNDKQLILKPFF